MLLCRRIPPIGIQLECRSANCLHSRNVLNFPEDSFFSLGIVCQIGSLFIRRLCLERAHLYMFQKWPIPYFQPSHQPIFLCIAYRQTDRQTKVNSALHFYIETIFFLKSVQKHAAIVGSPLELCVEFKYLFQWKHAKAVLPLPCAFSYKSLVSSMAVEWLSLAIFSINLLLIYQNTTFCAKGKRISPFLFLFFSFLSFAFALCSTSLNFGFEDL